MNKLSRFLLLPVLLVIAHNFLTAQKTSDSMVYVVDTSVSQVLWFCGNHYGCVSFDTGFIVVENQRIKKGEFVVDMNTIQDDDITNNKLLRLTLNNVIKSLPFFNVKTYPYSRFVLEEVTPIDSNRYHVTGILEIQDEVRDIDFDATITFKDNFIIVETDFIDIDRTNWGVNYLSEKFDPKGKETMHVPDTISFIVQLSAIKENDFKPVLKNKKKE